MTCLIKASDIVVGDMVGDAVVVWSNAGVLFMEREDDFFYLSFSPEEYVMIEEMPIAI